MFAEIVVFLIVAFPFKNSVIKLGDNFVVGGLKPVHLEYPVLEEELESVAENGYEHDDGEYLESVVDGDESEHDECEGLEDEQAVLHEEEQELGSRGHEDPQETLLEPAAV